MQTESYWRCKLAACNSHSKAQLPVLLLLLLLLLVLQPAGLITAGSAAGLACNSHIKALLLVLLPKNACKLASWQGPHLETALALDHRDPSRSANRIDGKGVRVLKALEYAQTHYLNRHSS